MENTILRKGATSDGYYELRRNNRLSQNEGFEAQTWDNNRQPDSLLTGVSFKEATNFIDNFIFNFIK